MQTKPHAARRAEPPGLSALFAHLGQAARAKFWIDCLVVGTLAYAYFRTLSRWRTTDDDEGFYLISGQQLLRGELPYIDFFFPQTPGSAFAYGVGQSVVGVGIENGRAVAAVMAAVMIVTMYRALVGRTGRLVAIAACAFCATHPLVASWMVVAKTISLQAAFGTAAVALAVESHHRRSRLFVTGALLGCAVACRATSALLALPVVLAVGLSPNRGGGAPLTPVVHRLLSVLLGCLLALLPVFVLAAAAPSRFWFDNVTFHSIYPGGERSWDQVGRAFLPALGLETCSPQDGCASTHNVILLLLLVVGVWRAWRVPREALPYLLAGLVCVAMVFIPVKTYDQYAVSVLPFLILYCAVALAGQLRMLVVAAALVSLPASQLHLSAYAKSDPAHSPRAEDNVARALDRFVGPHGTVSARWPNYLVACTANRLPAARNQFPRLVRVSDEVRARNLLFTDQELYDTTLAQPKPVAFVATGRYQDPAFSGRLQTAGWRPVGRVGSVEIWSP